MKLNLDTSMLKASLEAAATKDSRFYLNGVCLDFVNESEMVYVGTDGVILFAGFKPIDWLERGLVAGSQLIIPRETVTNALKGYKGSTLELESLPDGKYRLGALLFSAVDGQFPDYERVIPASCSGESGLYHPDFLGRAYKAVAMAEGRPGKQDYKVQLTQNGEYAGVVQGESKVCVGVVMPYRTLKAVAPYAGWVSLERTQAKAA